MWNIAKRKSHAYVMANVSMSHFRFFSRVVSGVVAAVIIIASQVVQTAPVAAVSPAFCHAKVVGNHGFVSVNAGGFMYPKYYTEVKWSKSTGSCGNSLHGRTICSSEYNNTTHKYTYYHTKPTGIITKAGVYGRTYCKLGDLFSAKGQWQWHRPGETHWSAWKTFWTNPRST